MSGLPNHSNFTNIVAYKQCAVCEDTSVDVKYRKLANEWAQQRSVVGFYACDQCFNIYKSSHPYKLSDAVILRAVFDSINRICGEVA